MVNYKNHVNIHCKVFKYKYFPSGQLYPQMYLNINTFKSISNSNTF